MLVRLHTFIRSVLRKNRSAFVPPDLLTESINQASFDLWRELIQDFRTTGKQSDLLSAFKDSSSPAQDNVGTQVSTSVTIFVTLKPQFDVPPTPAQGVHNVYTPGDVITYTVQASDPDPLDVVLFTDVKGKDIIIVNKIKLEKIAQGFSDY